jgi:predicted PurR-regulated permease PerM
LTTRGRYGFWLGILGAGLLLLYVLSSVLLPFVAGMAIAYLLDPVVDRMERLGCSRVVGSVLALLVFMCMTIGVLLLLLPVVQAQLVRLAEVAPAYTSRLDDLVRPFVQHIRDTVSGADFKEVQGMAGNLIGWVVRTAGQLISGGAALANILSILVITPIVAFYLLRDWDRIIARIDDWLPRAQAPAIREQAALIDRTLSAFVRGQGVVCLVLGGFYAIGLGLAGLQFGLVIGLFAGAVSFVPYVGTILGGVLSIGLALLQFDSYVPVAIVAGIFIVGQVVEGNVLTPNLVGDAVGLHPVWVIFALLSGGVLFGFLGLLLAVPAAAVIGVLTRFGLKQYLASPLHLHGIPPADDEPGPGGSAS